MTRLYAIARRIVRDDDLAKDAVQDGLIRAWQDFGTLRDPERFDAWLSASCQRLQEPAPFDSASCNGRLASDLNSPFGDDGLRQVADRDELERMFARLPVEHRAVLVLVHYVGMSAAEVGAALRIPVGTVYSRLHYGAREARSARQNRYAGTGQRRRHAMNDRRQMRFVEWLQDGPNRGPEDGLAEVFAVTRSMSQRPPLLGQWLTCRRIWAPSSTGCPGPSATSLGSPAPDRATGGVRCWCATSTA